MGVCVEGSKAHNSRARAAKPVPRIAALAQLHHGTMLSPPRPAAPRMQTLLRTIDLLSRPARGKHERGNMDMRLRTGLASSALTTCLTGRRTLRLPLLWHFGMRRLLLAPRLLLLPPRLLLHLPPPQRLHRLRSPYSLLLKRQPQPSHLSPPPLLPRQQLLRPLPHQPQHLQQPQPLLLHPRA
jgi:hypothetical protein